MKVSRRSTQRAAAIKNDPDLAPAVEHVTVADAYRIRGRPRSTAAPPVMAISGVAGGASSSATATATAPSVEETV